MARLSHKTNRKEKKRRIQKILPKEKPLTVCIAAIAESNTKYPKIVIAADYPEPICPIIRL